MSNEFLTAEQRVRLACVLRNRRENISAGYITDKFFLSAREILFVLDDETQSTSTLNRWVEWIINYKIRPLLRFKGYDGSEFSQEVMQ